MRPQASIMSAGLWHAARRQAWTVYGSNLRLANSKLQASVLWRTPSLRSNVSTVSIVTNRKYENGEFAPTDIDAKSPNVGSSAVTYGTVPYAKVVTAAGGKFTPEDGNLFDEDEKVNQSRIDRLVQSDRALLFVHGFNNTMQDAVSRGEGLARTTDLPVIVFDWPAEGRILFPPSVPKAYAKDAETANGSQRCLEWLINGLLASENLKDLYVMGHSMGSRIVLAAIAMIAHDYRVLVRGDNLSGRAQPNVLRQMHYERFKKLRLLILKQADVDVRTMTRFILKDVEETVRQSCQHDEFAVVSYVHRADKSLEFSQDIHYGKPRVGQRQGGQEVQEQLSDAAALKIIDSSACGSAWRLTPKFFSPTGNHSYFDDQRFRASLQAVMAPTYRVTDQARWSAL